MIVDEQTTRSATFTRTRFLARAGTVFTALAASWWFPQAANAAVPNGCHGYDVCSSCSGYRCTRSDCVGGYYGCESGTQCWDTCVYSGSTLIRIRCCDYAYGANRSGRCICSGYLGSC